MSSYDLSSYNLPHNSNPIQPTNFAQIDMQNDILQNKIKRLEKLINEYEKKEAVSSKLIRTVSKYINYLSNNAKRFVINGFKKEIEALVNIKAENESDIHLLITDLTEFISSVKTTKIDKRNKREKKSKGYSRNSRSVDFGKNDKDTIKSLEKENSKLKAKIDKMANKGKRGHNDLNGINQTPLFYETNISRIKKNNKADSSLNGKTLDFSKISELKSLNSFFNDELNEQKIIEKPSKVNNKTESLLIGTSLRESMVIKDTSVFLKKNNNTNNNTFVKNLSINDITLDGENEVNGLKQQEKVQNWIIEEQEDSNSNFSNSPKENQEEEENKIVRKLSNNVIEDNIKINYIPSKDIKNFLQNKENENCTNNDVSNITEEETDFNVNLINNFNNVAESREESAFINNHSLSSQDENSIFDLKGKKFSHELSQQTQKSNETLKMESVFVYKHYKPNVLKPIEPKEEEKRNTLNSNQILQGKKSYKNLIRPVRTPKLSTNFCGKGEKVGNKSLKADIGKSNKTYRGGKNFLGMGKRGLYTGRGRGSKIGEWIGKEGYKFKGEGKGNGRCLFN